MPKKTAKKPSPAKTSSRRNASAKDALKATKPSLAGAVDVAELLFSGGSKKKVLHVGSGAANPEKLHPSFRGEGWQEVRMDIDPKVAPDIVANMVDMGVVPDGAMDAVYSSHNLEHLYFHQVALALKEFYRVLKPGGLALITLPDIQTVAEYVSNGQLEQKIYDSPAGPITALDMLYGYGRAVERGNEFMAHRTAFTAHTLGKKLQYAGFANVQVRRESYDLWAVAYKLAKTHPKYDGRLTIIDPRMPAGAASNQADELDRPPMKVSQAS